MKKKILISFGTRPEAIKLAKLINQLKKKNNFIVKICVSGQHNEMLHQVLNLYKIKSNFDLKVRMSNLSIILVNHQKFKKNKFRNLSKNSLIDISGLLQT